MEENQVDEQQIEGKVTHEASNTQDESVIQIFTDIQSSFTQEQSTHEIIRGVVHELDQCVRSLSTHFSAIHSLPQSKYKELCVSSEPFFQNAKESLLHLQQVIPDNSYFRYNDHWRFSMQRLSYFCSLKYYLEQTVIARERKEDKKEKRESVFDKLATRDTVGKLLGVHTKSSDGFHIELDDYLIGILSLASELARLAVNSVILEDYHAPSEIASFVSTISSGFRLLNLKNDSLRRRFDTLKYDVKKIEEVVYDLKIRGL